jgi:uncharacterized protein (TIRG00374 family)
MLLVDNLREEGPLPISGSAPAKISTRRTLFAILRLALGIGILAYLYHSKILDFRALTKLFIAWRITLVAMAVLLVDLLLMSVRTTLLFKPQGLRLPVRKSFQLALLALLFSTLLPGGTGGDVAKLFYATKQNSGRRMQIATVVVFDRAIGFFSMLILPFFFVPFFLPLIRTLPALRHLLWTIACISVGVLATFAVCIFNRPLQKLLSRSSPSFARWRDLASSSLTTLEAYRQAPGTLLSVLLIALLSNLSVIAITALAVLLLNPAALAAKMCLVIPMGHIINGIPLTPGGLGVGEAAFNTLFKIAGLQGGAETLFIWRIWKVLISLLGFFVYLRGLHGPLFDVDATTTAGGPVAVTK